MLASVLRTLRSGLKKLQKLPHWLHLTLRNYFHVPLVSVSDKFVNGFGLQLCSNDKMAFSKCEGSILLSFPAAAGHTVAFLPI